MSVPRTGLSCSLSALAEVGELASVSLVQCAYLQPARFATLSLAGWLLPSLEDLATKAHSRKKTKTKQTKIQKKPSPLPHLPSNFPLSRVLLSTDKEKDELVFLL